MLRPLRFAAATASLFFLLLIGAGTAAASTSSTSYSISWRHAVLAKVSASTGGFSSVSCPAVNLCVAVDGAGEAVWSTAPVRASASAWHVVSVDSSGGGLTGVSCPTKRLCVAVDANGEMTYTTDPTGSATAWSTPVRIDSATSSGGGYVGLAAISCPSASLCVAVDNAPAGRVLVSRNPIGGAYTWRGGALSGGQLTAVNCPSTSLCMVTGATTYYSTYPRGNSAYWHSVLTAPAESVFAAIGCVRSGTRCVDVGSGASGAGIADAASIATSTTWTASAVEANPPLATEGLLDAVGCPSIHFCVAADSVGNVYTTRTPLTGNWSKPATLPGLTNTATSYTTATAISCTVAICVVVDSNGDLVGGVVNSPTTTTKKKTATTKSQSTKSKSKQTAKSKR